MDYTHVSKCMSLLLRHQPQKAHLDMDENGWVDMNQLVRNMNRYCRTNVSREDILQIVKTDAKTRYALSVDASKIRANQGHSIHVNMEFKPVEPPEVLFHGTGRKAVQSILQSGISKMSRQYVHLSADVNTAITVGKRHGSPCIFQIQAKEMYNNGYSFYRSENNVWLTDHVPCQFIQLLSSIVCLKEGHSKKTEHKPYFLEVNRRIDEDP